MGSEFTHVLDSLGWAVLHSLWQGGLAFLVVVVWRLALKGRSPALRHAGQLAALVGCLTAFLWTFAVYLGQSSITFDGGATLSTAVGTGGDTERALTGLIAPFDPATLVAKAGLDVSRLTPILACLWALGFALMSLRYAFAFGQVQQLRVLGVSAPTAEWQTRFTRLLKQSGVSHNVKLIVSANINGPMTLGMLKPIVLVPVGFLSGLPADQVEAVLLHEIAHIRRYDYALNLIQTAVKTVLFFHPAIHIISRWIDRDREQACDDLAVRQGRDPLSLVRGLAALRLQSQPRLGLAATGTGEDTPLLARLTRLTGQSQNRGRPEHMLMSVLSALLIGSVYLGSTAKANAHPVPPTAPAVPDSVISVAPAMPVPPVPPMLPILNPANLKHEGAIQSFIETDKALYKSFAISMKKYEKRLESYLKSTRLTEDARERAIDQFEDFEDEMDDLFEDRRDAVEDKYEDYMDAKIQGMKAAEKGLADAQRQLSRASNEASYDAQIAAMKQAQKALERNYQRTEAEVERQREAQQRQIEARERSVQQQERVREQQKEAKAQQKRARKQQEKAREQQTKAKSTAKHAALSSHHAEAAKVHAKAGALSRELHEDFRDIIMTELLEDGLIKDANQTVFLSHPNNVMSLNGKALPSSVRGKYCGLLDKHGFNDNHSEITIKADSLTILTDWKNGRHTTRVTYGTHAH